MQILRKSCANPVRILQREWEEEDEGEEEEEEVGLKKVLPPTRYSLSQAVTSGGNTFSQPRGGQAVGATADWCWEVLL